MFGGDPKDSLSDVSLRFLNITDLIQLRQHDPIVQHQHYTTIRISGSTTVSGLNDNSPLASVCTRIRLSSCIVNLPGQFLLRQISQNEAKHTMTLSDR